MTTEVFNLRHMIPYGRLLKAANLRIPSMPLTRRNPGIRPFRLGYAFVLMFSLFVQATELSAEDLTPFLSARLAISEKEYDRAKEHVGKALAGDPGSTAVLRLAFRFAVETGDREQAFELAGKLKRHEVSGGLISLVELVRNFDRSRYQMIKERWEDNETTANQIANLAVAWAEHGLGNIELALSSFDRASASSSKSQTAFLQHALILALVGDFEAADATMATAFGEADDVSPDVLLAWAQMRAQLDDSSRALDLLAAMTNANESTIDRSKALRTSILSGDPAAFDYIASPQEGLSNLFLLATTVLAAEHPPERLLLYARLGEVLNPGNASAIRLVDSLTEAVEGRFMDRAMAQSVEALPAFIAGAIDDEAGSPRVQLIALQSLVGAGKFDAAHDIAEQLYEGGFEDEIILLTLLVSDIGNEEYNNIASFRPVLQLSSPWLGNLVLAWASLAGEMVDDSLAALSFALKSDAGARTAQFQKALALSASNEFDAAAEVLAPMGTTTGSLEPEELALLTKLLFRQGKQEVALEHLARVPQRTRNYRMAALVALRDEIANGTFVPNDLPSPQFAMAVVFDRVARNILREEDGNTEERLHQALLYARLAEFLDADNASYKMLLGEILYDLEIYPLAARSFGSVPQEDVLRILAGLVEARALREAGEIEAALKVLHDLSSLQRDSAMVYHQMGDILRFEQRFEEARDAYQQGLALAEDEASIDWRLVYGLGIVNERLDNWENAEEYFRQALELSNENAYVLNYLGYSMVEKLQDLDEAEALIRKAVDAEPDNGFFVDSLGWVLYRKGQFDHAVVHLEYAVQLVPSDPIIIDHLGDAYWQTGENLNARLQWQRALSYDPEEDLAETIRRKLREGLKATPDQENIDAGTNGL